MPYPRWQRHNKESSSYLGCLPNIAWLMYSARAPQVSGPWVIGAQGVTHAIHVLSSMSEDYKALNLLVAHHHHRHIRHVLVLR
jgi:hypothetical protein